MGGEDCVLKVDAVHIENEGRLSHLLTRCLQDM